MVTRTMAAAIAIMLGTATSAHAFCSYYPSMADQLACEREKLEDARRAQEELNEVARKREFTRSLMGPGYDDRNDISRYFLDSREDRARIDLERALSR